MNTNISDQEFILFTSSNFPKGGAGAAFLNLFCKGFMLNNKSIRVYLARGYAFGNTTEKQSKTNMTSYGVSYKYMGLTSRPHSILFKLIDDFLSLFNLVFILTPLLWKRKKITLFVYHTDLLHSILIYLTAYLSGNRTITFVPEYFNKKDFSGIRNRLNWYNFIFTFNKLNPLSDILIVFSHFLRDLYIKKGVKAEKILVQPNLTDFEYWNVPRTKEKYSIGYSGTPGEKDGLIYLFKAISLLKSEIDVSLIVIGDSPFGRSMIPQLKIICESLGIKDFVTFVGLVEYEEVKNYLSQCKLTAITRPKTIQTQAGFPTKLGEYMALKKPVLSTDFGEVETYFTDGKEIVIAKCCDPESIAEKIRWMLNNENITSHIAETGFIKAYELLEYKSSVARIINFINVI